MDWQHPLLENGPSAPVAEALRYRFSNRHPQTETIGLGLGYRVFQPVPLAPIGPSWKKPTGAFEAATLTQACSLFGTGWKYQPVPKRLHACISVAASKAPVGFSNRYLWVPKAPACLPSILDPSQGSRFAGAGLKTGT